MNRNVEQHFQTIPHVDINRSRFDMSCSRKLTMNEGDLIPIKVQEILPGDSMTCRIGSLIRMMTPIVPVLDEAHVDIYAFFVPNRTIWAHWEEFCGANKTTYWTQPTQYTIPQVKTTGSLKFWKGSLADYMGLPINVDLSVSQLPFRAYCKIYNDWFWNENLFEPLANPNTDTDINTPSAQTFNINNCYRGGTPVKVGRVGDYFSGCLPQPQKGAASYVPLGNEAPLKFKTTASDLSPSGTTKDTSMNGKTLGYISNYYDGSPDYIEQYLGASDGTALLMTNKNVNLVADLSSAIGTTVNNLRNSFAVQRMLEQRARSGSRYIEILNSMFGVQSSDARLQRAEYLGGYRARINMTQVAQTGATSSVSPQGNMAAYSLTVENDEVVNKSFEEHGYVLFLACIRIDRTYQQGIERFWSRKDFVDFYLPVFANLSEMAVLNKEIYAQGTSEDDDVFGYQECWADYRYNQNMVAGELRSTYTTPLDMYHYGDYYTSLPILGRAWFEETKTGIQRTLAVQNHDQFICDFYLDMQMNRPMPVYSVPGLLDHN